MNLDSALSRRTSYNPLDFFLSGISKRAFADASYLQVLWTHAPTRAAFLYTAMALVFSSLSIFIRNRDKLLKTLMHSPIYPLRLLAYALRGQSLIARFRTPSLRAERSNLEERDPTTRLLRSARNDRVADYVIIGSGAAGAAVAHSLTSQGKEVLMLEEGKWNRTKDFRPDFFSAQSNLFRDFGTQVSKGRAAIPLMQGRSVGGTTVMNGAIACRLPKAIYDEWSQDKGLQEALPFSEIELAERKLEEIIGVGSPLSTRLADLPISQVLRDLGWNYSAMLRYAPDCEGTGRCLQGCPSGAKLSVEKSLLPQAIEKGLEILTSHRAIRIGFSNGRASTVIARNKLNEEVSIQARKAVVIAAGAIHSAKLLWNSGIKPAALGKHFQIHLSVSSVAWLNESVQSIEGPPQGIEVESFSDRGIKLATQLVPPELRLARTPLVGRELEIALGELDRFSSWMGSIRSSAEGKISFSNFGRPTIHFEPSQKDLEQSRFALRELARLGIAMKAHALFPGVLGKRLEIKNESDMSRLENWPLDPRAYFFGAGHLFGGCRMGSNPKTNVVGTDFRVHGTKGLFCVDASIFPSNIGVNPQHTIMALAHCAAEKHLLKL
jgi:choline dehydrogenase-like flavoprotein